MSKSEVESMLIQNKSWPFTIKGSLYISDVTVDEKNNIEWALGSFYPKNSHNEIIVEFQNHFFKSEQIISIFKKARMFTENEDNSSEMFIYPNISSISLGKPKVKNFYDEDSFFFQVEKIE